MFLPQVSGYDNADPSLASSEQDLERSRYRGIGIAQAVYHHISTHNLFLVAMAAAGKIGKSLASMGGRLDASKARSSALELGPEQC